MESGIEQLHTLSNEDLMELGLHVLEQKIKMIRRVSSMIQVEDGYTKEATNIF